MIKHSREVIEFVESLFGSYVISDDELPSGDSSYNFAMRYQNCEEECPGIDKCSLHGYVPRVYEETLFGKRVFTVRAGLCTQKQSYGDKDCAGELLQQSRIPPELASCTFDNYKPVNESTKAAKKLAKSCAEEGIGLMLEGPPGVGKTHLAVAVVYHAISVGHSAIFTPVVNLLDEMQDAVMNSRFSSMLEDLRKFECMVLDDMGISKVTSWRSERLYELINDRYNAKKQIIVTTNARNSEDLKSMLGDTGPQIESRLSQMTASLYVDAQDFRKHGKRER